ncbi:MAG TPA: hypothetical protein VKP59_04245 [Candidatus Thermoplasmatota archaeon]|nr:hypothetical protein [Candidatus Thermoplasmatota archaeon]
MKNQKKVFIGMLMLIIGWVLFAFPFFNHLNFSLYLILLSLLFISIGFWLTLSNIKEKISYSAMGLLDAISAPIFIYLSMSLLNFNYIQMSPFITSLIFGIIGAIIGIVGIFGEMKSLKILKSKNNLNSLLILQIILWFVSMLFAIVSPGIALDM